MDGLIAILVIFAIINAITSKNKKKAEEAKKKAGMPQSATQPQRPAQPQSRPKPHPRSQARPQPQQVRIPYSKEEWAAYLSALNSGAAASPKPAPAPKPEPELHEGYEGMVSTQGESAEEHAKHHRRIQEEEARRQQEYDALADLREANLDKLRAAVVMSEVLGKPVSLRPRTGYRR